MEVYIDDMLVKSVKAELHITHLTEAFQVLKSYNMKLNPAKCAYGVSAGKFLGFIVNSRGIEANPDKIKVVLDMLPPSNIKDIQRLTGRIAALSRFVSKASEKCQPFFQVLKKPFQLDAHCKEAFVALKTYMSSANIIFASAFDKMGIENEKLEPVNACLRGFFGEKVLPLGSIQLILTLGDPPCQATTTVRFLIVDAPSAYNMLLGRPSLNTITAIPSAYHMVIKFPTINGV